MLRPIQVWLAKTQCTLDRPLSRWDAVGRGFLGWWEHDQVWWLPTIRAQRSWHDAMGHHLAIPAEQFEHATVLHIGANGYAYGIGAQTVFPEKHLGTILDEWLHADSRKLLRPVTAPEAMVGKVPQFADDGRASYAEVTIPVEIDAPSGEVPGYLAWEGRLRPLFPPFTDHLPLRHLAAMLTIATDASEDADAALRKATVLASPYVQDGHSTSELAWFRPLVVERGESDGLRWTLDAAARRKLGVDEAFSRDFTQYHLRDMASIDEVLRSAGWQQFLRRQIPIRRVWGPIGLFWALLLDQLESRTTETAVCARCGRTLTGKRGKRFCGREDDPDCHRERRAEDQRRSRTRRRGK